MKRATIIVLGVVIAGLLLAGCSSIGTSKQGSKPAPATTTSNQGGTVLFKEDFSNPDAGWDNIQNDTRTIGPAGGAYRIYLKNKEDFVMVWNTKNPGMQHRDNAVIEVDAKKAGGHDMSYFGLSCRIKDERNYYDLVIGADGYYSIGKVTNGESKLLYESEEGKFSDAINKGNASNHLRADCIGDTLALYANGQKLVEVKDSEFREGYLGLEAGSPKAGGGTDILFDNFVVKQP